MYYSYEDPAGNVYKTNWQFVDYSFARSTLLQRMSLLQLVVNSKYVRKRDKIFASSLVSLQHIIYM